MVFLRNESVVYGSIDAGFVVTTHRIRMDVADWG
jgi:hypothetical protein